MNRCSLLVFVLTLFALLGGCVDPSPDPRVMESARPNILLIYTDDQRWDSLCPSPNDLPGICANPAAHPMPRLMALKAQSVAFSNAFVTNPLCCPSRASFLKGGLYSHHTGIMANKLPNGGAWLFDEIDEETIATWLQEAGYLTALVGNKYLNGYDQQLEGMEGAAYVPPGWDRFAPAYNPNAGNWLDAFDVLVHDELAGEPVTQIFRVSGPDEPDLIEWERMQAADFIEDVCPTNDPAECAGPFFLMYSAWAPHLPARTPQGYSGIYSQFNYNVRAFNEAVTDGLTDKPAWVQANAPLDPLATQDRIRAQLRQLRWLDDQIGKLIDETLDPKGLLENTIIIFASDNGFQWGEHGLMDKSAPYEEALRVPLFIYNPVDDWLPGVRPELVAADLDLAPTILELVGASPMPTDGQSLVGLIENPGGTPWRDVFMIMGSFEVDDYEYPHAWVGVRQADGWKYIEHVSGERELYYLVTDPFEKRNLYGLPGSANIVTWLQGELATFDRPLTITTEGLPDRTRNLLPAGIAGAEYNFQLQAKGGVLPYTWEAYQRPGDPRCTGGLPAGLSLSPAGTLAGVPAAGVYDFCVTVGDSSGMGDWRRFSLTVE